MLLGWWVRQVGRFLIAVGQEQTADMESRFAELNGGVALVILAGGKPDTFFQVDIRDGVI
ncbi:hypothetical protein F0344_31950 [Streptomyces finlayi]|uniref:Uncharacterized protein n=1 Tax=Streptomyces finlayi TaxID=67296 RepID=A0A7G7BTE0_9ACTN|nr:hypothetical protein [Streptomyces finlayi]QNE78605.1 hypothetical protein F0344_31950 [Streptomyces finlayi]